MAKVPCLLFIVFVCMYAVTHVCMYVRMYHISDNVGVGVMWKESSQWQEI